MDNCIFCQIISGNIPAHVVYEDDLVVAILDHRPVHPGHCMVIPKQHFSQFTDLPDELAGHIAAVGNRLGRKIMSVVSPKPMRVGFVVHGYVPHVHYHVIPQHHDDDITSHVYARIEEGRIVFDEQNVPLASPKDQVRMAKLLALSPCPADGRMPPWRKT
ncbi:MAG TPA: HIT family protein [Rhodospirillaceae bacterium]|nr:MAG: hypothetical protein A2018_01055 [Alphaproteobacteria bacterium GWF2_58_20]HAU29746.1 HIT family protein [Rhodospirillaceae bacterium]